MGRIKPPKLNIAQQYAALKRDYWFGETRKIGINQIIWKGKLKSSPIGDTYLVKVSYRKGSTPKVYILDPSKLRLPKGENSLEHVYNHDRQQLCLFYPKAEEWNETKTLASTILPWTIDWLYHYEIWLITGIWEGGGIHPGSNKKE